MKEQMHTKGPWTYKKIATYGDDQYEIHWSPDGECVAEIVHGEANARVISATPDLLTVCDSAPLLSAYHRATGFDVEGFIDAYDAWSVKKRAAIAKAKAIGG